MLNRFRAAYAMIDNKIFLLHPGRLESNKLTPLNYELEFSLKELEQVRIQSGLNAAEAQWLEFELQRAQAIFYRNIDFKNPGKFQLIVQNPGKLASTDTPNPNPSTTFKKT